MLSETLEDRRDAINRPSRSRRWSFAASSRSARAILPCGIWAGWCCSRDELLRATTPSSAIRSAVQSCFRRLGKPIVALLPDPAGTTWSVVAAHGVGTVKREELQRCLEDSGYGNRADTRSPRLVLRHGDSACRATRSKRGTRSWFWPTFDPRRDVCCEALAFLGEALDGIGAVEWAQARTENLDLALACTAHELKAPLVGARAALDRVTAAAGGSCRRRAPEEIPR